MKTISRAAAADTLRVGIKSRQFEVIVTHAAPAPVDVEEILTLIAVADKFVATTSRCSAITYGTTLTQLMI